MLKYLFSSSFWLLVFLFVHCKSSPPSASPVSNSPAIQLSDRLAKIKMSDLNGKAFTLQQTAGKPVFLNFWATWCRPCVSEMESIEAVYQQFKDEIVFIAVSPEDPAKIQTFLKQQKFSFKIAHLDMEFLDAYVVTLPTTFLINRNGELVAEEEGLRIWTQFNNMEKLKALAKRP